MDIRPIIVICILILVAIMAISFLIPNKLRWIKYFCWGTCGLLLIFIMFITPYNIYYDNKESYYLFGTYELDLKKSNYKNIDLSGFKSLTLKIKNDYTFSIDSGAPFLTEKNGTWLFWIDGEKTIIHCKFKNAKYAYPILQNDSDLIFTGAILKQGAPNDQIAFKKITASHSQ